MKENIRPQIVNRDGFASLELTRQAQNPYSGQEPGVHMPDGTGTVEKPQAQSPKDRFVHSLPEPGTIPTPRDGEGNPIAGLASEQLAERPYTEEELLTFLQNEGGEPHSRTVLNQDGNETPPFQNIRTLDENAVAGISDEGIKNKLLELKGLLTESMLGGDIDALHQQAVELAGLKGRVADLTPEQVTLVSGVIEDLKSEWIKQTNEQTRLRNEQQRRNTLYGERKLENNEIDMIKNPELAKIENDDPSKPHDSRLDLERLFNRMFDRVDGQSHVDFQTAMGGAGQQEWSEFNKYLHEALSPSENKYLNIEWIENQLRSQAQAQGVTPDEATLAQEARGIRDRRTEVLEERKNHYIDLYNTRRMLHDANYAVLANIGVEKLNGFVSSFRSGYADLAFRKRGVQEAYRFYTQALLRVRTMNGGFIPETAVVSDIVEGGHGQVDVLAMKQFRESLRAGIIRDPETGDVVKNMNDDEINAAFEYARGLGIMLGTTTEIAATSIIPDENPFVGLFAQAIVEKVQVFRTIKKYDLGGKGNSALGMLLNRKGRWTRDEFEEFKHADDAKAFAIMNGLVDEDGESGRLIEVLNLFGMGGVVSTSTWRAGEDTFTGSLSQLTKEDRDWVGAGLIIEKNRSKLIEGDSEAERVIRAQLERMSRIQAVAIYNNVREVQAEVLKQMYGREFGELRGMLTRAEQEKVYDPYLKYRTSGIDEGLLQAIKSTETYKQGEGDSVDRYEDAVSLKQKVDFLAKDITELTQRMAILQEAALQRRVENFSDITRETSRDARIYNPDGSYRTVHKQYEAIENISDRERQFAQIVQNSFNIDNYIKLLKDKGYRQPFVLDVTGLDNHEIFWAKAGDKAIARRWGDMMFIESGSEAVIDFVTKLKTFASPEEVAEGLQKIYDGVKGYDSGVARDITKKMGEAAIKFYSKDWYYRAPSGIGAILGLTKGAKDGISWSQALLGSDAMAWDEIDANKLTQVMRAHGTWALEDQRDIQKKTIAKRQKVLAAYARFGIPVVTLAILFWLNREETEEER